MGLPDPLRFSIKDVSTCDCPSQPWGVCLEVFKVAEGDESPKWWHEFTFARFHHKRDAELWAGSRNPDVEWNKLEEEDQ